MKKAAIFPGLLLYLALPPHLDGSDEPPRMAVSGSPSGASPVHAQQPAPTSASQTRELEVCLEFRKSFADAAAGDWWTDNHRNAAARGVLIEVDDDTSTRIGRASETNGCATFEIEVAGPLYAVDVRATSDAKVSGVVIHSYADDPATPGLDLEDTDRLVVEWNNVSVASSRTSKTFELPLEGEWMHLAVATMVFRRSDFNITTAPSRACCTDETAAGYVKDGTCADPDYETVAPPVRIHHSSGEMAQCGGSTVDMRGGVKVDQVPALALDEAGCGKFLVAHELGHVIEMMRTGGRTRKDENAAMGGCDARVGAGLDDSGRGRFTKEYMSLALREGWADFVATWTWNRRTERNCTYQSAGHLFDFDLDGTADNDEPGTELDHQDDCHGTPFVGHDHPAPMDRVNWLDDLQDPAYAHHCEREPDDAREANRSTVYDVAKMFWQLNHRNGQGVEIATLTDLYVDMCPRQWAMNDDEASPDASDPYVEDDLPLERLKISAAAHGLSAELDAALPHVAH